MKMSGKTGQKMTRCPEKYLVDGVSGSATGNYKTKGVTGSSRYGTPPSGKFVGTNRSAKVE